MRQSGVSGTVDAVHEILPVVQNPGTPQVEDRGITAQVSFVRLGDPARLLDPLPVVLEKAVGVK